jgi:hypothetical protein
VTSIFDVNLCDFNGELCFNVSFCYAHFHLFLSQIWAFLSSSPCLRSWFFSPTVGLVFSCSVLTTGRIFFTCFQPRALLFGIHSSVPDFSLDCGIAGLGAFISGWEVSIFSSVFITRTRDLVFCSVFLDAVSSPLFKKLAETKKLAPFDPVGFQKNRPNSIKTGRNLFDWKCEHWNPLSMNTGRFCW